MRIKHGLRVMCLVALLCPLALAQGRDESREKYEKVADILAAVQAEPGKHVADVGSGEGFYSVRIARAVGSSGRVTAVDISEAALKQLRERLQREAVANVDVALGAIDDPRLQPNSHDAALIYNSYHEMTEYLSVLRGILAGLKPGGRLVIIEPIHDALRKMTRAEQTAKHEISDELTAQELEAAGFEIARRDPAFRPFTDPNGPGGWWLIVALKPAR